MFCTAVWADDGSLAGPEPDPDDTPLPAEVDWGWQPGDLIFRNGVNPIYESIKRSLGLKWASVGILRPGCGGPRVVHVDQADGVTEDLLYEYVERLSPGEYAVYHARDPAPERPVPLIGRGDLGGEAFAEAVQPRRVEIARKVARAVLSNAAQGRGADRERLVRAPLTPPQP